MSSERQMESFQFLTDIIDREFVFKGKDEAREFFTKLTGLYKNWNYSAPDSPTLRATSTGSAATRLPRS